MKSLEKFLNGVFVAGLCVTVPYAIIAPMSLDTVAYVPYVFVFWFAFALVMNAFGKLQDRT